MYIGNFSLHAEPVGIVGFGILKIFGNFLARLCYIMLDYNFVIHRNELYNHNVTMAYR